MRITCLIHNGPKYGPVLLWRFDQITFLNTCSKNLRLQYLVRQTSLFLLSMTHFQFSHFWFVSPKMNWFAWLFENHALNESTVSCTNVAFTPNVSCDFMHLTRIDIVFVAGHGVKTRQSVSGLHLFSKAGICEFSRSQYIENYPSSLSSYVWKYLIFLRLNIQFGLPIRVTHKDRIRVTSRPVFLLMKSWRKN